MNIINGVLQSTVNRSTTLQQPLPSSLQMVIFWVLDSHSHNFMQCYAWSPRHSNSSSGKLQFSLFYLLEQLFILKQATRQKAKLHKVLLSSFWHYLKSWVNIFSAFGDCKKALLTGGQWLVSEHLLLHVLAMSIYTEPWLAVREIFPSHCLGSLALRGIVVHATC